LHEIPSDQLHLMGAAFGQMTALTNNTMTDYLTRVIATELARRNCGVAPKSVEIILPIGDSTGDEVTACIRMIVAALKNIPDVECASARFLSSVYFEIESAAHRIAAAAMN